ncbi:MAG: hypothetical protein ACPG49_12750, partial [Chitinophagales bacterium]
MKKLLLSLLLLIFGIQNTINDSSLQAYEVNNNDVLQKTLEEWCLKKTYTSRTSPLPPNIPLAPFKGGIKGEFAWKDKTLLLEKIEMSSSIAAKTPKKTPAKAKVPIDKI